MSFSNSIRYHFLCISVIPTYRLISFFGSSECSTSALTRRSRNGRRTLCSCLTTASGSDWSFVLNHASKSSLPSALSQTSAMCELCCARTHLDENTSGRIKFNSAHSSWRLFCSGVPVINSLPRDVNIRMI